ncbi:TetR/AcrR family transcriptional regulator [Limimaricola cinnabarinus]|uniref:TetR/AcrR family transcriptional regulator n=1 Tax=Limimaricola cinnabarinus TaxID=1125964 RepID=UPI000696C9D5|nr:TetR/AcrR family transcriptional regulator [Limimaricola cinnabarinus]
MNKNQISRERSKTQITDAAFRMFIERGYHATSLDAIAQEANLTKGSVYFYFGSKEKLALHLFNIIHDEIVCPQVEAIEQTRGSFVDKVVAYIHVGSNAGVHRPHKLLFMIQMSIEFGFQDTPLAEGIRKLYSGLYASIEAAYEQGLRDGTTSFKATPQAVSSMVVAVHDGMMLQYNLRQGEIDGPELVKNVRKMVLSGLNG